MHGLTAATCLLVAGLS
ncbi:unnamed protein product, partial [Ophioblennius macclurei]